MAGVTDNLAAFLNARLDEDERDARELLSANAASRARGFASTLWDEEDERAQRLLREVEAKRAILRQHHRLTPHPEYGFTYAAAGNFCGYCGPGDNWQAEQEPDHYPGAMWPCQHVRLIAAVWSDHPDYREEWKP